MLSGTAGQFAVGQPDPNVQTLLLCCLCLALSCVYHDLCCVYHVLCCVYHLCCWVYRLLCCCHHAFAVCLQSAAVMSACVHGQCRATHLVEQRKAALAAHAERQRQRRSVLFSTLLPNYLTCCSTAILQTWQLLIRSMAKTSMGYCCLCINY